MTNNRVIAFALVGSIVGIFVFLAVLILLEESGCFRSRRKQQKDQRKNMQHHRLFGRHQQQRKQQNQALILADAMGIIIERTGSGVTRRDIEMISLGCQLTAGTGHYSPISHPIQARQVPGRVYEDEEMGRLEGTTQLQALPQGPDPSPTRTSSPSTSTLVATPPRRLSSSSTNKL